MLNLKRRSEMLFIATAMLTLGFFILNGSLKKDNSFISYKINKEVNEKPRNGFPGEAMKFYYEQRAYPIGKIPADWRSKAMEEIKTNELLKGTLKKSASLNWTELGPNNIGGRIRSIVINPHNSQIIFAGSVSGGVWKSTDGGNSWKPVKDQMENLAVCSMAIDPVHPDTIWAGTGEGFFNYDAIRGEGIFRTTDGGNTWVQLDSTKNEKFYYVNKLAYDKNTSTLWAATRKGLYRSTDAGKTFKTRIYGRNNGNVHCTDLEISNSNPSAIFAAFGLFNQSVIVRSTDGGVTFSQNHSEKGYGRIELAISPSNPNVIYASLMDLNTDGIGKFLKSTDNGDTWTPVLVPGPAYSGYDNYAGAQGWYDNILAVNPSDSNSVFAGGIDLWKSTDGGSSWNQISNWYRANGYQYIHADFHAIAFDPNNSNVVYVGTDGGIFKSTDGGASWVVKNNNLDVTQFYYGTTSPDCGTYYGGSQDNGTIKSDGSASWYPILNGDGGAVEVSADNPQIVYLEYVNLAIFKSYNGGTTIDKSMNGIPTGSGFWDGTTDRTLFISPFIMDPNNSATLLAGTYRVWETTNGGSYWNSISSDLTGDGNGKSGAKISTLAIAPGNSNVIYAGCSNGVVQVTTDNGGSWTNISSGLPDLYCTRIAVFKDHPETAVASFSGFSNGEKVYKTTNYGNTWTNISGDLPNVPVNAVLIYPASDKIIIAGTDLGVFVTLDGGTAWNRMNEGMANVPVFDLDYCAKNDLIFAATHGRGMFKASASPLTSVESNPIENISFKLEQNYPNPFGLASASRKPVTTIAYNLKTSGNVKLVVFDLLGRRAKTLVSGFEQRGRHKVEFNASGLPSGAYFYRLESGGHFQLKKMILVK